LIGELPVYFSHAENVPYDVIVLEWWFEKRNVLPRFYNTIIPIAVVFQPSSGAAAERVFSMLRWMFGENQASLLEDCKETSMMMR